MHHVDCPVTARLAGKLEEPSANPEELENIDLICRAMS